MGGGRASAGQVPKGAGRCVLEEKKEVRRQSKGVRRRECGGGASGAGRVGGVGWGWERRRSAEAG